MEMKPSRQAKDHVFVDLFNRREYCYQLYRALHPEAEDVTEEDIENITISHVIVDKPYNDLGFTVKGRLVVLVEAQSTWSYNILLRLLLYLADTILGIIGEHEGWNIHGTRKLPIPEPEFYVIYTGERRDVPETISLRKDFFESDAAQIDLTARVISVESTEDIVGQYIIYAHVFDQQIRRYGYVRKAAEETIRVCKDRGVLKEYLTRHEKEVMNHMIMLFEQEEAVKRYGMSMRQEGIEEGRAEGRVEGRAEGRVEGRVEGQAKGMDLFGRLLNKLLSLGRNEDVERVASDAAYREQLFKEFKLT